MKVIDKMCKEGSKYYPLCEKLKAVKADGITGVEFTFEEIEKKILFKPLPKTAYKNKAWWSNNPDQHVQAYSWLDAGFEVATYSLDFNSKVVRFVVPEYNKQ